MKTANRMKRYALLVAAVFALAFTAAKLYATGNETLSDGQPVRWNTTPIPYVVNPNGVPGFTTDLQKLVVIGAVADGFRAWATIPQANIRFSNAGTTSASGTAGDGVNVVSFENPNNTVLFRPGVLAIASYYPSPIAGPVQVGNRVINAAFAGQLLDADITFNPQLVVTPIGGAGADLVAILMHEVGHLLGLDHTGVLSSIMNPFGESGTGTASRRLESDDALTAAALYPDPNFSPLPGSITGRITSGGAAVKSAHVVAISVPGGVPVASQLSGADGVYNIKGLPAGDYQVMVEPLDGPVELSNFPGFYSSGQANFATTFSGGLSTPAKVSVGTGQTATADVAVPAQPAGLMNIVRLSALPQATTLLPSLTNATQYLPRGRSYQLFVAGSSLSSDSTLRVSGSGITLDGSTTTPNLQATGLTLRQQNLTVNSSAAIGPSNIILSNSTSTSAVSGGIVVTVNPAVSSALDGAGFRGTLAPGSIFSIFGSDLASGRGPSQTELAAATPLPTDMGGVNVKVGDRFAPLFFVSPGQINAMIPFETTGTSATLNIETGPGAEGKGITINLSPTAPGIFSTNSSGAGQGAILNADSSFVAPRDSIPGAAAHPAKAGDVIIIYASGLGPVTPVPPSGVPAGANGDLHRMNRLPQVSVGGQVVAASSIDFAGLAPGFVGLYQINVRVPATVSASNAVPIQVTTAEGQTSNTVTIAVEP
ncbi:MAG: matrixin family metalloprotease [Acidobacteria bacterium]|nr:matrixin family metalloprotease [Acidobacteriota bacterium]